MFKLLYNNRKKGLSMMELLIAITLTAIVLGAFGTAFYVFQNSYNSSILRSRITNAVQLAAQKFETNTNLITNSKEVDIFYDSVVDGGIIYDKDTGTFDWKDGSAKSVIMPEEGVSNSDPYTYIYSTPAYDSDENFLGHYLFIRNYLYTDANGNVVSTSITNSELFLDDEGMGDIPVEIELKIGTNYLPDENADFKKVDEEKDADRGQRYADNCVQIIFKSGKTALTSFSVETKYALGNFNGKTMNMRNGKLIMESAWCIDGSANAHPCGWNNKHAGTNVDRGYPKSYLTTIDGISLSNAQLQKSGNVLRFLSPLSDSSVEETVNQGSQMNKGSCFLEDFFLNIDTSISEPILDGCRDIRDEVLAGTEFGDWFIYHYYNTITPFYYENKASVEPVLEIVAYPVSWICSVFVE